MRLNDPLVTSFLYGDKEYSIDLAFDNVLDVFDVLNDSTLRDHEKADTCLALLLGNDNYEKDKLVEIWNLIYEEFIKNEEKQPIEYDLKGNPMPVKEDEEKEQLIDLDKDAQYIYASFRQAYDINLLNEQGRLHWQEFQALLHGLPDDTILKRIIQIRGWKPSKGDSADYKEAMRKLQKVYALNDTGEEVE
ncbi:Gp15 family bacteriophage protein [Salipaludibacillus agaradhaerens]|uniref:Gp15 family bacteriophage protein n=1 Tax=Salipaludibacillus agaradhaerens TaxID=76935 RepID=UPI000996BB35|nr:Gp15 family bacteriophage protein [Salipaludibacillus agaradhaerens]